MAAISLRFMRDNAAQMEQALERPAARPLGSMNATDNMQSYARLAQVHATICRS